MKDQVEYVTSRIVMRVTPLFTDRKPQPQVAWQTKSRAPSSVGCRGFKLRGFKIRFGLCLYYSIPQDRRLVMKASNFQRAP